MVVEPVTVGEMRAFVRCAADDPVSALASCARLVAAPEFRSAVHDGAAKYGVNAVDLVPELAGRAVPDGGCWVQVGYSDSINEYAQTFGFSVEAGSVWWATPCRREVTAVPVAFADPDIQDQVAVVSLPLRLAEVHTPCGPLVFYPHEYRRLHTDAQFTEATAGCQFHPYTDDDSDTPMRRDQVFYLQSRGIDRETAVRMVLRGWFTPVEPARSSRIPLALEAMSWMPEENHTLADSIATYGPE